MRWKCFKEENSKPKTADNDITVYKVMLSKDGRLYSYFQGFEYQKGSTYFIGDGFPIIETHLGCTSITDAYHSYDKNCSVIVSECYIMIQYDNTNIQGYTHSDNLSLTIVQCTIPKGSTYYLNERGEYASNQIIINGIAKIFNNNMNVIPLSELGQ